MKNIAKSISVLAFASLALTNALAQRQEERATDVSSLSALGLPRLAENEATLPLASNESKRPPLLNPAKYEVDSLLADGVGVAKKEKKGLGFLSLEPESEWRRPLRGSGKDVQFVSFAMHASLSSIVRVGDAWLAVTEGPSSRHAQVMVGKPGASGIDWQFAGIYLPIESYEGKSLVALQTVTIRLDPKAKKWDLYMGKRLYAEDIPFFSSSGKSNPKEIAILSGKEGAWVFGLVQSDDNPIYEDTNANGVDDEYERQSKGGLSPLGASEVDRAALMKSWREDKSVRPSLAVKRVLPDRFDALSQKKTN